MKMIQCGVVSLREDVGDHDSPRSSLVSGTADVLSPLSCGRMLVVEVMGACSLHSNELSPFSSPHSRPVPAIKVQSTSFPLKK